jgi:hypothetical protein
LFKTLLEFGEFPPSKHKIDIPSEYMNEAKDDPLAVFNRLMAAKDKEKGILDSAAHYGSVRQQQPPQQHHVQPQQPQYGYHPAPPPVMHYQQQGRTSFAKIEHIVHFTFVLPNQSGWGFTNV